MKLTMPRSSAGVFRRARLLRATATGVCLTAATAGALAVGGCGIIGALAYKFSPPPVVEAEYVPANDAMLVIAERGDNPSDARLDADRIAREVTEQLKANTKVTLLDPAMAAEVRDREFKQFGDKALVHTRPPTPIEIGRAAGAAQVLYIDITRFSVEPALASEMMSGQVEARVKVLDTQSGQLRWPAEATQGRPVSVTIPYTPSRAATTEQALRDNLGHQTAAMVARLFFKSEGNGADSGTPHE